MKFILPLLLIAFSGFTQDTPKRDPNTGLPTSGNGKKQLSLWERRAKYLASVLQGASRENVEGYVANAFSGNTDKQLNDQLETKLKLGMKRNKLSQSIFELASYSQIVVEWDELKVGGRVTGYLWEVRITRNAYVGGNIEEVIPLMNYRFAKGIAPEKADLKDEIDSALDKIFLVYLELPEPKKKK